MLAFPRRLVPSTHVLRAFEAAARHQSFTVAAEELSLTQSAISRLIRALEESLGAELFVRERQTVRLTMAAEAYAQEIRCALQRISRATLGIRANPGGGGLNIAILPMFGMRWLAPRLPRFLTANPDVMVNLTTRLSPFDFQVDTVDAAIHFGAAQWPGAGLDLLMGETVVPACSPALLKQIQVRKPGDLRQLPLLHLVSRPDAWERWFQAMQVPSGEMHGMLVDQFAVAEQAALAGLGVGLFPRFLIESDLASGHLVVPIDKPLENAERYYLAWPLEHEGYPPLEAFRAWICREARAQ